MPPNRRPQQPFGNPPPASGNGGLFAALAGLGAAAIGIGVAASRKPKRTLNGGGFGVARPPGMAPKKDCGCGR